jgi:LuxR family transcriptional regulator, maltose regulon positive regulatory protein
MVDFPHKIQVPQRPALLVSRPRLLERLRASAERRLTALSAPAGYGKTSLLIDFTGHPGAPPVCWYTLDRYDEDPWVFLEYLAAAIEHRFPGAAERTLAMLAGRSRPAFAAVTGTLVRELYALPCDFALLIDDWHLVDHVPDITEVIAQILLQCPRCHLVLASRSYPSIPDIMLLAARRQMGGLDEEELRFTPAEVVEVVGQEYPAPLSLDHAEALVAQTNGWITGILLSLQVTGAAAPVAPPAVRAERQIYAFLAEQVLDRQPEELLSFLLDSALLDELTPERCDAILGREDSGRVLDQLLRQHLFITAISPGVLRYHPLFREFLQEHGRTVAPGRYHEVARRVAGFYRAQRQWTQAFDACMAAGDRAAAAEVAAEGGDELYGLGRLETLERWFAALPLECLDAPLLFLRMRVLLERGGEPQEARVLADLAEMRQRPGDAALVLLMRAYLARIRGQYAEAVELARRAQERADEPAQQTLALRILATCRHRLGHSAEAFAALEEALAIERRRGDLYAIALIQQELGVCHEEAGLLRAAEEYYTQADAYWATIGNTSRRSMSLNSKGVAQHMAGRYREAHATLLAAQGYAAEAAALQHQALIAASQGDLYRDLRLWARAQAAYDEARRQVRSAYLQSYVELALARLLICRQRYDLAATALQRLSESTVSRAPGQVALLRGQVAHGLGRLEEARRQLGEARAHHEAQGKQIELARALVLEAQILASVEPSGGAFLAPLEEAAAVAERLGHDAFLVAETFAARGLLRRAVGAGWPPAEEWLRRQQEMRSAAAEIERGDHEHLLAVSTLGVDRVTLNGRSVEIGWLKAREVFYYLLTHPEGATSDTLREAIWPDLPHEASRNALKTAIYQLRGALPRELIELQGRLTYRLNREAIYVASDCERFVELVTAGADDLDALQEAIDLYNGPFLPWSDNSWCREARAQLEQRHHHALHRAAARSRAAGLHADALALYQRLVSADRLDEAAHAGVMRAQLALGNRAAAMAQYHELRRALDEELGLTPDGDSEVEQLYRAILRGSD